MLAHASANCGELTDPLTLRRGEDAERINRPDGLREVAGTMEAGEGREGRRGEEGTSY